jgi:type VI secretion system secreted protein Hcp
MTTSLRGSVDMFLSVKGDKHGKIEGESQDAGKHKNEIEVLGWSWGMQAKPSLSVGSGPSGRATIRELKITKRVDRASPALMGALRYNETIKAVLTVRKFGKTPLETIVITIDDGRVTGLDVGVDPQTLEPLEQLSLSFQSIEVVYTPQAHDGSPGPKIVYQDEWSPL